MKNAPLLLLATMLTACASSPQERMQQARVECINFGYKPGTQAYTVCVDKQYNKPSAFQEYMMKRAANPQRSNSTTCQPWLDGVRCTSD